MSSVDVIFVTFISKYTLVWSEIKVSQITETEFEDASFTLILWGRYGSENKDTTFISITYPNFEISTKKSADCSCLYTFFSKKKCKFKLN